MVLLPPEVERIGYELLVRAYRAENLPKLDTFGKVDGYIKASFTGSEQETSVIKSDLNPVWNTELRLPVYVPTMSDRIAVRTMDWERAGDNRPIATMNFKWSSVLTDSFGPAWVNTYGSPPSTFRDKTQLAKFVKMIARIDSGNAPAYYYKGRVLLSLIGERAENPSLGKTTIAPCEIPPVQGYVLHFDLYLATEVRQKATDKVVVSLRIGHLKFSSKAQELKGGKVEFFEQFDEVKCVWPRDIRQVPDIIVDVKVKSTFSGDSRIGFVRMRAEDVLGFDHKPEWHTITPDTTSAMYEEGIVSGFLLFNIGFGCDTGAKLKRAVVKKPMALQYQVRAHIYQARNLPAADDCGTSDPYVQISYCGREARTRYVPTTLFPIWYETLRMNVDLPLDPLIAPPLVVFVYDYDQVGSDDLIGRVEVPFSEMTRHIAPEPRWYPLYMGTTDEQEGELLASFQLIPSNLAVKEPIPVIRPPSKPSIVEFRCIGLRGLQTTGTFNSISKPYLEIDCGNGGLLNQLKSAASAAASAATGGLIGSKTNLARTKASDAPTSTSPNFLEVIHFHVNLPLNPLFAPTLNARVYDSGLLKKKLIGSSSIPLGPYIPWSNEEIPRYNLPEKADTVPGSSDEIEQREEVMKEETAEEKAARLALEKMKAERERMDKMIPKCITEANEKSGEEYTFEIDADAAPGSGVRTLPDVADTKIGSSTEVAEEPEPPSYDHELEFELKKPPFDEFPLWVGQKYGLSAVSRVLSDKTKPVGNRTITGKIKANLSVFTEDEDDIKSSAEVQKALRAQYTPQPFVVRAYILRGRQLVPVSSSGSASPFITIYNGTAKENMIDDRENKKAKTLKPDFYKCYELPATIPGNSDLTIEVWDHNAVGSNDLIGRTVIDLETRLFCKEWNEMKPKPVEWRALWNPGSSFPQGKIELWLEIMTPEEARLNPPKPIAPPTVENWELRCVVWNTKEVVFKDIKSGSPMKNAQELEALTGGDAALQKLQKKNFCQEMCSCKNDFLNQDMSDIYVSGKFGAVKERQETDVHWRSTNGEGNFNWRFVFPVVLPCPVPRLKIQIWDKNVVHANASIAEAVLHLGGVLKVAYKTKCDQSISKQWVTMTHPMFPGPQGKVELSLDFVSDSHAKSSPAGKGRNKPNQDPMLEEPQRPETSFPPWAVHKYVKFTFRAYKKRILFWGCIVIVVILVILILLLVLYFSTKK